MRSVTQRTEHEGLLGCSSFGFSLITLVAVLRADQGREARSVTGRPMRDIGSHGGANWQQLKVRSVVRVWRYLEGEASRAAVCLDAGRETERNQG